MSDEARPDGDGRPAAGAWRDAVDERLLARCEAHETRSTRLQRDWSMPVQLREPRVHLDPSDWRAGYLRADREYEIPHQLRVDIRENMPQALLRDLFRPERQSIWIEREPVEGTGGAKSVDAMRLLREARQLPTVPRVDAGVRVLIEHQVWRRAMLAERWRQPREGQPHEGQPREGQPREDPPREDKPR